VETTSSKVLIIDDEPFICQMLSRLMTKKGYRTSIAANGMEAMKKMRVDIPDAVLTDVRMPGMDGMAFLKNAKKLDPDLPVILITGYADIPGAVNAMRSGAYDYLPKPFDHDEVTRIVRQALQDRLLKNQSTPVPSDQKKLVSLHRAMGSSEQIAQLIRAVSRVATTDFSVIVVGETGSGKELVSRAIHQVSRRKGAPFVALDCGAIPETLFESELFGHEKGSFTGAVKQKIGKLEAACNGTLLLDEIGNLSMGCQAKLLRALQEKKVYRVGGTEPFSVDVRIMAATNIDLETCSSSIFRKDLFFRLNEFMIRVPPLRERPDDIPYLCKRFLDSTNAMLQKKVQGVSPDAMNLLMTYPWPGNVRELKSVIRRAVLMADNRVTKKHLDLKYPVHPDPQASADTKTDSWKGKSLREIVNRKVQDLERKVLADAIQQTGGNKAKAARRLKIDYKTIHTKIKNYGISFNGEQ
jgi:DNA-binding NtrC family response regulator